MDLLEELGILAAVVLAYFAALYLLHRSGQIGPDRALSLFGPALMIKTRRGRSGIDRIGRFRRFWSAAADLGILLAGLSMLLIMVLLVWEGILATQIPASAAPSPQEAIGLPGINPIIPLGYGIVALVVGIVLHELAHGVVARSQKVGVKSLGILWFVIPVGAFVEQDEAEMNAAPRRRRMRIAAAGILANFALAILFFALLGAAVSGTVVPNAHGVGVAAVVADTPAANNSLAAGDIITSVNGTATPTSAALLAALANTTPGERVSLTFYDTDRGGLVTIAPVLAPSPSDAHRGFLGIELAYLTPQETVQELSWPPGSSFGVLPGLTLWVVLPLAGIEPASGSTVGYFHLVGPLAALGTGNFWILANVLYWLSWMNLLLGMSNSLPLIPLDGGLLFRDMASGLLARIRRGWDAARLELLSGQLTIASSILVLFLIVWQFVAPHL
ncbi:MAG: site-2 protease family protein [Thermoplasmata archaeon]